METCNGNIQRALELSRTLIVLADEGEAESEDDGCILLYSVVRDCAYRIRKQAEREKEIHKNQNRWS